MLSRTSSFKVCSNYITSLMGLTLGLLLTSCLGSGPGFFSKNEATGLDGATVATSATEDGVTTGSFAAASRVPQTMEADPSSVISGTSLILPPGALSGDAGISIELGTSLSSDDIASLGIGSDFQEGSSPVVVRSTGGDPVNPFTLVLPINLSLRLALADNALTNVAVLYQSYIYKEDKTLSGIMPASEVKVEGGKAYFTSPYFGSFQVVFTAQPVVKKVEKPAVVAIKSHIEKTKEESVANTATPAPASTSVPALNVNNYSLAPNATNVPRNSDVVVNFSSTVNTTTVTTSPTNTSSVRVKNNNVAGWNLSLLNPVFNSNQSSMSVRSWGPWPMLASLSLILEPTIRGASTSELGSQRILNFSTEDGSWMKESAVPSNLPSDYATGSWAQTPVSAVHQSGKRLVAYVGYEASDNRMLLSYYNSSTWSAPHSLSTVASNTSIQVEKIKFSRNGARAVILFQQSTAVKVIFCDLTANIVCSSPYALPGISNSLNVSLSENENNFLIVYSRLNGINLRIESLYLSPSDIAFIPSSLDTAIDHDYFVAGGHSFAQATNSGGSYLFTVSDDFIPSYYMVKRATYAKPTSGDADGTWNATLAQLASSPSTNHVFDLNTAGEAVFHGIYCSTVNCSGGAQEHGIVRMSASGTTSDQVIDTSDMTTAIPTDANRRYAVSILDHNFGICVGWLSNFTDADPDPELRPDYRFRFYPSSGPPLTTQITNLVGTGAYNGNFPSSRKSLDSCFISFEHRAGTTQYADARFNGISWNAAVNSSVAGDERSIFFDFSGNIRACRAKTVPSAATCQTLSHNGTVFSSETNVHSTGTAPAAYSEDASAKRGFSMDPVTGVMDFFVIDRASPTLLHWYEFK